MSKIEMTVEATDEVILTRRLPPPPPPVLTWPTVTKVPVNPNRRLCFVRQYPGIYDYQRYYHVEVLTASIRLAFRVIGPAGVWLNFAAPLYKVMIDGVVRGEYRVVGTEKLGIVFGMLGDEADGDHLALLMPCEADGTPQVNPLDSPVPFVVTVNRQGKAKDAGYVISQSGAHQWARQEEQPFYTWAKLPLAWFAPKAIPLPPQPVVPFEKRLTGANLWRYMIGPTTEQNSMQPHHLCYMDDGTPTTACMQGYFPDDQYLRSARRMPNVDGERNICTHYFNLFLLAGRERKRYAHNAGGGWTVTDKLGKRTTLWGRVQDKIPYFENGRDGHPFERLVGVCTDSRVPPGEAYLHESWGGDFDHDTTDTDPNAPPIGGEQPHPGDVRYLATDMGVPGLGGCVWELLRSGTDRAAPTRGRILISGLNDPFFLRHRKGTRELIIGVRGDHGIGRWNADTGEFIAWIIRNPRGNSFGSVPPIGSAIRRWNVIGTNLVAQRAEPILCPEGGDYYRDAAGREWVVWGSPASADLRRVALDNGELQIIGPLHVAQGSVGTHNVQVCVNDNTKNAAGEMPRGGFGVHGTVFAVDFHNKYHGRPHVYEPTPTGHLERTDFHDYDYHKIIGRGPYMSNDVYPLSLCVGYGELTQCSTLNGMVAWRQLHATDPNLNYSRIQTGHIKYKQRGWDTLALYGFSPNGIAPFGVDADIDYLLDAVGVPRPA